MRLIGVITAGTSVNKVELGACQAVQGKTNGKLNIPAVLGYGVNSTMPALCICGPF
jgi:hypothetical protein